MSSYYNLLSIIVISIVVSVKIVEPKIFCDYSIGDEGLVEAVFNLKDEIYLIRGNDYWTSEYLKNDGKPDPTPKQLNNIFKVDFKQLMTGFMVESIPKDCNSRKVKEKERERCTFNAYMLNTTFIFYKRDDHLRQVYSMLKSDQNSKYVFDKEIGGYGYLLRANQTVVRSSWPGIEAGKYIVSTLYVVDNNLIVYFLTTDHSSGDYTIVRKPLTEEWDNPHNGDNKNFPHKLIGIFRKNKDYYFINKKGFVYKFKDNSFVNYDQFEEKGKVGQFFGC